VRGADAIVVQGGINDLAQGRPPERAAENLREVVRRAKERGLRVALANVLPWNNGGAEAAPKIRHLNELLAQLARAEDVALLDFHAALEDPEAPDRIKDEWAHADGDHPSPAGYRRLGEGVSDDLLRALEAE
jgi:lysophospholipase L1-like esterase